MRQKKIIIQAILNNLCRPFLKNRLDNRLTQTIFTASYELTLQKLVSFKLSQSSVTFVCWLLMAFFALFTNLCEAEDQNNLGNPQQSFIAFLASISPQYYHKSGHRPRSSTGLVKYRHFVMFCRNFCVLPLCHSVIVKW